jgi:hypothetical protein
LVGEKMIKIKYANKERIFEKMGIAFFIFAAYVKKRYKEFEVLRYK